MSALEKYFENHVATQGDDWAMDVYVKALAVPDLYKEWEAEQDPMKELHLGYISQKPGTKSFAKTIHFKDASEHDRRVYFSNDVHDEIKKLQEKAK